MVGDKQEMLGVQLKALEAKEEAQTNCLKPIRDILLRLESILALKSTGMQKAKPCGHIDPGCIKTIKSESTLT